MSRKLFIFVQLQAMLPNGGYQTDQLTAIGSQAAACQSNKELADNVTAALSQVGYCKQATP